MTEFDLEATGARIEELLERLGGADPRAARIGEELVRALVQLYGAGLERILETVRAGAPQALPALAADPLVAGLLALHDLHPTEVTERIEAALDDVRPYLGSHGGDVSVLAVDGDTVRLRLEGSCNGCGSSEATLTYAVEGAVLAAAPEIAHITVEGAVAFPEMNGGLIPADSLSRRPTGAPA